MTHSDEWQTEFRCFYLGALVCNIVALSFSKAS